jgi:hypothetical protein
MKKAWLGFCILAASLLPVAWLSEGCNGTLPALPQVVATPLPSGYISDFDNGTLNMNPSLLNGNGGYFLSETYGGAPGHTNEIDGSTTPNILVPDPGDGSRYAVHVYGPQSDPLPTTYPAMEVFGFLKNTSNNLYDLTQTPFTGIRFDVKILPYSAAGGVTVGDNNPQKRFAIACAPMVPPTTYQGGICPPNFSTNCYNYFWAPGNLPTTNPAVNDGWKPVSFLFTQFRADAGYGNYPNYYMNYSNTNGTLNTGNNFFKTQALFLLWKFGDNGAGGNTYTDFWIDNVQFY